MSHVQQEAPARFDIPHEPGNWIMWRRLSQRQLQKARGHVMRDLMEDFGKDALQMMMEMQEVMQRESREGAEDALSGLSPLYVFTAGVVEWHGPIYDGLDCTTKEKQEIDEPTVMAVAIEIAQHSRLMKGESPTSAAGGAEGNDTETHHFETG